MSTGRHTRQTFPVWTVLVVVIVIAGIAAIVLSVTGGDSGSTSAKGTGHETAPVKVIGRPLPQFETSVDDAAIGRTAPTLEGSTFQGTPITIPAADGNAKAIFFVAHWCPHCQAEIPRLEQWLKTHGGVPAGLTIEIVSTRVNESPVNYPPSAWLQREGLGSIPTLADDKQDTAYFAYGAGGLPYIVYLDKDNKVVLRTEGEYGTDPNVFTNLFERLAAGQSVTDPRG
jgi:thiol-disulfide isomerase/thioredoxin